ncbi:LOW QUALITY PROTEIN: palmdelphin-like [Salarias fasciatus]|uniref:LOW QUALITY PROTEIN: palmdelphin-like n=1 Tax=Salarias fasciatus TaxID=181472 RepID=UPI0011770C4B|nr:LOW QUALITY PROTEIN: palmdelphin [Salarias fasciatus]
MEEADLLKERLQAITDKRRIQEDIAKKRRQIEEEKLKLQYIKKKALRDQWLMDGVSQQSEEEQEAMRLQAQEDQQQSDQLQSNILRIEKEIEALETQELSISANEETVLKRLKEVERTAEDIIKELKEEFLSVPDIPSFVPAAVEPVRPAGRPAEDEPKRATFAMEISVEHDRRTGKCEVVSTATVPAGSFPERGLKVYEDGRRSVYALPAEGAEAHPELGEMTLSEVEELLRQATDRTVPSEVQYHQPVYSAPYSGTSRPSTPRTHSPGRPRHPAAPGTDLMSTMVKKRTHSRPPVPASCIGPHLQSPARWGRSHAALLPHSRTQTDGPSPGTRAPGPRTDGHSPGTKSPGPRTDGHSPGTRSPGPRTDGHSPGTKSPGPRTDGHSPGTKSPGPRTDGHSPGTRSPGPRTDRRSLVVPTRQLLSPSQPGLTACLPPCRRSSVGWEVRVLQPAVSLKWTLKWTSADSHPSMLAVLLLNLVNALPEGLESEPVTMIFMGYENAADEDEDIQAELVIVGNSEEEEEDGAEDEGETEEYLSYHPQGYQSKVFRPKVGVAKLGGGDVVPDTFTHCDDLEAHKPTFVHKPGKTSPCLQGQGVDPSTNTGPVNLDQTQLCSTGR